MFVIMPAWVRELSHFLAKPNMEDNDHFFRRTSVAAADGAGEMLPSRLLPPLLAIMLFTLLTHLLTKPPFLAAFEATDVLSSALDSSDSAAVTDPLSFVVPTATNDETETVSSSMAEAEATLGGESERRSSRGVSGTMKDENEDDGDCPLVGSQLLAFSNILLILGTNDLLMFLRIALGRVLVSS